MDIVFRAIKNFSLEIGDCSSNRNAIDMALRKLQKIY